ncbi:hypothetical protein GCM10009105_10050 [Dokdonella soli]|uniref:Recombinase domain-containing protein n=1 Tax=Dokdonella soli TaxID=529810 RepID=A0ABN1IER4_9GAMM
MIADELGRRYEPVHTTKGGRRYRYYVSRKQDDVGHDRKQGRLPAEALEQHVTDRLATYLASPDELLDTLTIAEDEAISRNRPRRVSLRFRVLMEWRRPRGCMGETSDDCHKAKWTTVSAPRKLRFVTCVRSDHVPSARPWRDERASAGRLRRSR